MDVVSLPILRLLAENPYLNTGRGYEGKSESDFVRPTTSLSSALKCVAKTNQAHLEVKSESFYSVASPGFDPPRNFSNALSSNDVMERLIIHSESQSARPFAPGG
jgi:hypothetical protein